MHFLRKNRSEVPYLNHQAKDGHLIFLYNFLSIIGLILFFPVLVGQILASKKRRKNILARLGFQTYPRFPGCQTIWVHALSVGETLSSLPLLKQLRMHRPNCRLVFSVSTVSGFEIAHQEVMGEADAVFYFPFDVLWSVRRAIRHIKPSVFFLVESDLWPNVVFEMKRKKVPSVLVNGRISPRSFRGYKKISFLMEPLFSWFSLICVQSPLDAERFLELGAPAGSVHITGNIKFDQEAVTVKADAVADLRKTLGISSKKRIIVAGSTHEGEEKILVDVFFQLKDNISDVVLFIVPRDPTRAREVRHLAAAINNRVVLLSELTTTPSVPLGDIVVVDAMGMLGQLYFLADVAFVGGSLIPCGGHNPLEPAAAGKPIVFGPHMTDFVAIADMLKDAEGAVEVRNGRQLYKKLLRLLNDRSQAKQMGDRAFATFQRNKGAVQRVLEESVDFLKH